MGNTILTIQGRDFETLLDAVGATGAGDTHPNNRLNRLFSVVITGVATCVIEGSVDGVTWHALETATATSAYASSEAWPMFRGNVTAYTSGTVTLQMAH